MTIRTAAFLVLASLSVAAPVSASPMPVDEAALRTAAFLQTYGSDAYVRFLPSSRGATFLGNFRSDPLARDPVEAAWRFLERESAILGLTDPRAALHLERAETWRGWTTVRLRQTAWGRPVLGRGFVVVADDDGRVYQVSGGVADVSTAPTTPLLDRDAAVAALLRVVPQARVTAFEPALLADGTAVRLVNVVVVEQGGPLDRFEVLQDAVSGRPITARRMFLDAQARVYDPNPVSNPILQTVELQDLTSTTNLDGRLARAFACATSECRSLTQRAVPDASGDYLYDLVEPSLTDEFAEVMVYYHVDKVNRWFEDTLDFELSCGGHRWVMGIVNLDYANAFYGDMDDDHCGDVSLGQGTIDFAYDGDVIYHEFTHGIVEATAGLRGWGRDELGPDYSSGGLNEGTADYFSCTLAGDPDLGEYISREGLGGELGTRHADNDNTCPLYLEGESHGDGKIWLGTLWEIRTAIGAAKTDPLAFAALQSLSETADFDEAGRALVAAAGRLVTDGTLTSADQDEVERIVGERGLIDCVRIIDLYDPDTFESFTASNISPGLDEYGGWISEMYSGVQYRIRTPLTAFRMSFVFTPVPGLPVDPNAYDLYSRQGSPIHFSYSGFTATIDGYDIVVTGNPDAITYATWTDPLLEPGAEYYFTYAHRNGYPMWAGVTASISVTMPRPDEEDVVEDVPADVSPDVLEDVPEDLPNEADASTDAEPDAEPDAASDTEPIVTVGGDGCGCRTIPPRTPWLGAALLLGLALLLRRRSS
ncbi:MAG: hypothetical protein JXB32_16990 [Deltaproteobacteria bacterium]|nr:hypothetical protein [Deltaproteobacteria bacterium]